MNANSVGAGHGWSWLVQGWQLFTREPGLLIAMFLTMIGIQIVLSFIPVIGQLASMLLAPAITGGVIYSAQVLDQGNKLEYGDMFQAFKQEGKLGPMVMLGVVSLVLMIIAIIPMAIGMAGVMELADNPELANDPLAIMASASGAVLVMATIIMIMIMLMFYATPLVMLRDVAVGDALKASFSACLRNILPLTWYGLIATLLAIVATIPAGVGLLVLAPVMMMSQYASYKDIFEGVEA